MTKSFGLIFVSLTILVVWFGLADSMLAAYLIETKFPNEVNALWRACNGNVNCGITGVFMNILGVTVIGTLMLNWINK